MTMNRSGVRVLRMRGLPYTSCNSDIVTEFFKDFNVEDIRIGMRQGKPTGEAFVRFSDERNCSEALAQLDKQMLGKRYIELFKAKDQDLDSSLPEVSISGKCNVIRMRGLPFSACIGDILDFFKNVPALDTEQVYFVYDSSGRPSGEAYISFLSSDACAAAMKLHKNKMGSRYIELFPSSSADLLRAAKQRKLRLAKIDGTSSRAQTPAKQVESKPSKAQSTSLTDAGSKQPHSEKPAHAAPAPVAASPAPLAPAPAAPPLRRTFASITAAPPAAPPAAVSVATPAALLIAGAPRTMARAVTSPTTTHHSDDTLAAKLGGLDIQDARMQDRPSLSPTSADAQPNTAAAAAAAVLGGGNSFAGDCSSAEMPSFSLPQPAHMRSPHMGTGVADLSALPTHDTMGAHRVGTNGMAQAAMGSTNLGRTQLGGFVPDQMPGYGRHNMLARPGGGYPQHLGGDFGAMAGHGMLTGGGQMAPYPPAATVSYAAGAHVPPQQLRLPHGQPPAASNNRQNVPPNVPPPRPHDEVWNMWGQPTVPGGIRDLWQSDMGLQDNKKMAAQSFDGVHQIGQFPPYNIGPTQQNYGYSQPPYYQMDGSQGSGGGNFREF